MNADVFLAPLLWAHVLAASLWVGGILVYGLTAPLLKVPVPEIRVLWRPLREWLRASIGVFVISGTVIAAQRFASATLPPIYFAILLTKVALGVWMFSIARAIGVSNTDRRPGPLVMAPEWRVCGLGVIVYGLAVALRMIYESALHG